MHMKGLPIFSEWMIRLLLFKSLLHKIFLEISYRCKECVTELKMKTFEICVYIAEEELVLRGENPRGKFDFILEGNFAAICRKKTEEICIMF